MSTFYNKKDGTLEPISTNTQIIDQPANHFLSKEAYDPDGNVAEAGGIEEYVGYITPQMFGAKGDGITDDTEAIQDALNDGRPVYFPKGIYIVTPKIIGLSNIKMKGEFGQSIIKISNDFATPSVHLFEFGKAGVSGVHGITIDGLTFRGSETFGTSEYGASLLMFWGVSDINITNCLFQNNMYSAVQLSYNNAGGVKTGCHNITVTDCRFEACDCGIVSGNAPTSDVFIKGCYFSGKSTLNNFTNYFSEQIGTYAQTGLTEPNSRWVIEDCVFEYKHTAAISFVSHGSVASGEILNQDISIRNCTFRSVIGAIALTACENVSVDGMFYDGTPNAFPSTTDLFRIISINNSKDITIRNITSENKELKSQFDFRNSENLLVENIDTFVDIKEPQNALPYCAINGVKHSVFKNFYIKPIDNTNKRAVINIDGVSENNLIDICGNSLTGAEVNYLVVNPTTVANNIFRINTDNNVSRTMIGGFSIDNPDSNKWVKYGNGKLSATSILQINQYTLPMIYEVAFNNQTQYEDALAVENFYPLSEGAEVTLAFVATNYTNGKTFTFNTMGNIISIDTPIAFSDDYKTVCKFVQKNSKWVEVERTLEYYEGVNESINSIPTGGTTGQVLTKKSNTDYDTEWSDASGGVTPQEVEEIVNGYPSYVNTEKKAVLSRLWTTYASVHNPVVVGFNTDQHLHNNMAVERVAILTGLHALRDMTKEFPFNVCVLGGDACGNSTIQAICNEVNDVTNALDGANCPVIHISGNHDSWNNNNNMIKGQLFSALATSTFRNKVVTTTENTNNCYYDDEVNQIRYIFLNDSSMRGYDLNKINVRDFMIDALETLPDFFAAIIFSHHPLGNLTDAPHTRVDDWNDPLNFGDYVAPYKDKIIACICGHVHADKHEILDGILYLSTTCAGRTELNDGSTRTDGQADVTAQDVMVIDREHYVIHCIRYGNGNDRNITYYVPTYTNVLATAIDTDGEIFNGIGYQEGKRLNSSGGTTDYDISDVSGYIPVNANDVIRIRGAFMSNKKDTIINYINFYNSDFSFKSGKQAFNWWLGKDTTTSTHDIKEMTANNGNIVEFKVPENADFDGNYMRISCELLSQAVITINEDIPLK